MRKYGKTSGFKAKPFACILYLIQEDKLFASAPYKTKAKILKEKFNIDIYYDTIRKWLKPMIDNEDLVKNDSCYWRTETINGEKIQIPINTKKELKDHENYKRKFDETYNELKKELKNLSKYELEKMTYKMMYQETKTVYYKSKIVSFNGFVDEDLQKLYSLVPLAIMED
ncbi:MAG: hypothetical protein [Caudoviricetes sp.]|nr:MAG: hypothetical protein [Caudoviricetes sp.]